MNNLALNAVSQSVHIESCSAQFNYPKKPRSMPEMYCRLFGISTRSHIRTVFFPCLPPGERGVGRPLAIETAIQADYAPYSQLNA